MSFKSGIASFVAKRSAFFICVLSLANLFFIEKKYLVLFGLLAGGLFSILKFCSLSIAIYGILDQNSKNLAVNKSILRYLLNFVLMAVLMVFSLLFDKWFGAGMITGILIVPFVIMINNITEGLGITHNNFK